MKQKKNKESDGDGDGKGEGEGERGLYSSAAAYAIIGTELINTIGGLFDIIVERGKQLGKERVDFAVNLWQDVKKGHLPIATVIQYVLGIIEVFLGVIVDVIELLLKGLINLLNKMIDVSIPPQPPLSLAGALATWLTSLKLVYSFW